MELKLPEGTTQEDLREFLQFLSTRKSNQPKQEKRNCYNCLHFKQTGDQYYQGYCALYSCDCATLVLNHEPPIRWMLKEDS